jgi:membrane-associated phospholipid phosphatase
MYADRSDQRFARMPEIDGALFNTTSFGTLWSTRWYSWVVMSDLARRPDWLDRLGGFSLLGAGMIPWADGLQADLATLREMAFSERQDAIDEIVTEADEFISKFLHLVSATPTTHPATSRMLIVADALTALITMHYKAHFNRARPAQLAPALMPPIEHAGHASFPSGHATQAHIFAALLTEVMPKRLGVAAPTAADPNRTTIGKSLVFLADRIARNREIAGLHDPSDTRAGVTLAGAITSKIFLDCDYLPKFAKLVDNAKREWENTGVIAGEKNAQE